MRNRIALSFVVTMVTFGFLLVSVSASAQAATRSAENPRSAKSARSERPATSASDTASGPITVHRLFQARLELARRVALALRLLDQPAEPKNGTHTIIDEPDPAGFGDDPSPELGEAEDDLPPGSVDDDDDGPVGLQAK